MINSIDINMVRRMCDKAGFRTKMTDEGLVILTLTADSDFGYDVYCFFTVEDDKFLRFSAYSTMKIGENKIVEAILRINKINEENRLLSVYIDEDRDVFLSRQELIDEYVSEEWVYENFINILPRLAWDLFKNHFSDF